MDTVLILATRGRPHNLIRFMEAYEEMSSTAKVVVGLDDDDPVLEIYREISKSMPKSFQMLMVDNPSPGACVVQNKIFEAMPDADVYGIIADDVVPMTVHWDNELSQAAYKHGVAFCADGMHDGKFATHPFIEGDLVRDYGFIAPDGLKHLYVDNFWFDVGQRDGIKYLPDVRLEHRHWCNGKAPKDDIYNHQYAQGDEAVYRRISVHG